MTHEEPDKSICRLGDYLSLLRTPPGMRDRNLDTAFLTIRVASEGIRSHRPDAGFDVGDPQSTRTVDHKVGRDRLDFICGY